MQPKDRYVPRIFGFELHETSTELQIYQGITTGYDHNAYDSASSGHNEKEEEKRDLVKEIARLNEMEEEKENEENDAEKKEEEQEDEEGDSDADGVVADDEKGESEDMDLSDLDENDWKKYHHQPKHSVARGVVHVIVSLSVALR